MSAGNFNASLTPTPPLSPAPQLSIEQFYPSQQAPPGSIGVCLSGGGSRALTAGMGELQALSYLTFNGSSMLGQIKALSTVSGGSWLGVPYMFLQDSGPSDSSFLGTYTDISSETLEQLGELPSSSAAYPISGVLFDPVVLAVQAVILCEMGVPPPMIWQTIIGLNILFPAGLYTPTSYFLPVNLLPADMFSYDAQTLSTDVTGPNPSLAGEKAYLVASGSGRTPRPYLVCNISMLLNEAATKAKSFAPVQATPFMTGIVGAPTGTDQNGLQPGGGGVTSFAFNSNFTAANGNGVSLSQTRQWSLTDIRQIFEPLRNTSMYRLSPS